MRLKRVGRKNEPSYRVIVVDKRESVKSNNFVAQVGTYNPKSGAVVIDGEAAKHWLSKGVQPSGTVHNMLVTQKVIDAKKINVLPKKTPPQKKEAKEAVAA